jgi:excisionase family DNA binding protein
MLENFLTAKEVCARLGGVSDMTLWRWMNAPELGFPRPVYVRRRRLFREAEVAAWIETQELAQPPAKGAAA